MSIYFVCVSNDLRRVHVDKVNKHLNCFVLQRLVLNFSNFKCYVNRVIWSIYHRRRSRAILCYSMFVIRLMTALIFKTLKKEFLVLFGQCMDCVFYNSSTFTGIKKIFKINSKRWISKYGWCGGRGDACNNVVFYIQPCPQLFQTYVIDTLLYINVVFFSIFIHHGVFQMSWAYNISCFNCLCLVEI